MKDIEQYRPGFEAWASSKNWIVDRNSFGEYRYGTARDGWEAWTASKLEASTEPSYEQIAEILKGIDDTETGSEDGWWETSLGARFGAEILEEIRALFKAEAAGAAQKDEAKPEIGPNPRDNALFADMHARKEDFSVERVSAAFRKDEAKDATRHRWLRDQASTELCTLCNGAGGEYGSSGKWWLKCPHCDGKRVEMAAAAFSLKEEIENTATYIDDMDYRPEDEDARYASTQEAYRAGFGEARILAAASVRWIVKNWLDAELKAQAKPQEPT